MKNGASTFAQGVDLSLYIISGISIFFLVAITAVMIYFVIRYNKKRNPKATNIEGNNTLEVLWTVIPTILVLVMFYYGWMGYKPMRNVPADAIPVKVYGQMWKFSFEYANGKLSDSLVVPVDKPVKLFLISKDVNHSFYIPAFRLKEDLIPGKNNFLWFEANKAGKYDVMCAEYCGQLHSAMLTSVNVVDVKAYEKWLSDSTSAANEHPGLTLMKKNACFSCHTQDGSKLVGPSFKGVFGRTELVDTDGSEHEIVVNEEYIKRSVKTPNADVVKGYMKGLMVPYDKILTDEQIDQIIEYLKTVK
ncbi:MAG: cytochrome c oxidase subunit II [Bacteroidales bacterium]|nr:cytochrome c oxidase subunit II [Bacteroidales bacterium]